jgi:hypothetical protein
MIHVSILVIFCIIILVNRLFAYRTNLCSLASPKRCSLLSLSSNSKSESLKNRVTEQSSNVEIRSTLKLRKGGPESRNFELHGKLSGIKATQRARGSASVFVNTAAESILPLNDPDCQSSAKARVNATIKCAVETQRTS